jgi:hypothetical protein
MLKASVSNVSSVFLDVCCKCFYLDVAYVSQICLQVLFDRMLHMFCNGFSSVLGVFSSVSDACFKCFIFLQTHVAKVSSGCCKSRTGVIHVAM